MSCLWRAQFINRGYYDITCPHVDTDFIFECSTRYRSARYRVEQEKITSVSTCGHVIFCLLYRDRWRDAVMLFSYWLRLTWPRQSRYLHRWRIKIVSSPGNKFSSLEKSWHFIRVYIIKWVSFFFGGGGDGGYFWEVVVGVHRPPHLIFTL